MNRTDYIKWVIENYDNIVSVEYHVNRCYV